MEVALLGGREMLDALRDGGPKNSDGGGAREGCVADVGGEVGERLDIFVWTVSARFSQG